MNQQVPRGLERYTEDICTGLANSLFAGAMGLLIPQVGWMQGWWLPVTCAVVAVTGVAGVVRHHRQQMTENATPKDMNAWVCGAVILAPSAAVLAMMWLLIMSFWPPDPWVRAFNKLENSPVRHEAKKLK